MLGSSLCDSVLTSSGRFKQDTREPTSADEGRSSFRNRLTPTARASRLPPRWSRRGTRGQRPAATRARPPNPSQDVANCASRTSSTDGHQSVYTVHCYPTPDERSPFGQSPGSSSCRRGLASGNSAPPTTSFLHHELLRRDEQGRILVQQRRDGGQQVLPRASRRGGDGHEGTRRPGPRVLDDAGGRLGRNLRDVLPRAACPGAVAPGAARAGRCGGRSYSSASSMWGRRSSIVRYIQSK